MLSGPDRPPALWRDREGPVNGRRALFCSFCFATYQITGIRPLAMICASLVITDVFSPSTSRYTRAVAMMMASWMLSDVGSAAQLFRREDESCSWTLC